MTRMVRDWGQMSPESWRWFERAQAVLPDGVASPVRGRAAFDPYPLYMVEGKGAVLRDVDGNSYIDTLMAFGPVILGHAHPAVTGAVAEQVHRGLLFGACHPLEVEVAERICQMVPTVEKVRFANSGTEATMHAIRLARGFTGKKKILKFEGHYHGNHDAVLVSVGPPLSVAGTRAGPVPIPSGSGIPQGAYADTVVAVWNDLDLLRKVVRRHRDDLAAIIVEPIMANKGFIGPEPGYLQALQETAREHDVLFILDEVITGFRLARGGAQEYFGLRPDISTFAKAMGNGAPIAAFGARREIMDALQGGRVRHAGTYNASPLGLAASRATLDVLNADGGAAYRHLHELGEMAMAGLREIFGRLGIPAIVQGIGPMFQVYLTGLKKIRDYREACSADLAKFQRFAHEMIRRGIWVHPDGFEHWFLSTAHTREDIGRILAAAEDAAKALG